MTVEYVNEKRKALSNATSAYSKALYDFFSQALVDVGFKEPNKKDSLLVHSKYLNKDGILRVESTSYMTSIPSFCINFYPLKVNGGVSLNSRYAGFWVNKLETVKDCLKECFTLAEVQDAG